MTMGKVLLGIFWWNQDQGERRIYEALIARMRNTRK